MPSTLLRSSPKNLREHRGEGAGRGLNSLRKLRTACKRLRLNRIRSPEGPQKLSLGWWKDPYFLMVLPIQYKNLLLKKNIFKGVVICNVVQIRPRAQIRIQNTAVPDSPHSPGLFNRPPPQRARVCARTRSPPPSTSSHAHRMHSSPWPAVAPAQPWLLDAGLACRRGPNGRVRGSGCAHSRSGHNHLQSRPPVPAPLPVRKWAG